MNILFLDFETTGIPIYEIPSGDPSQPHIVQLAGILVDSDTREEIEVFEALVRPDGWEWNAHCGAFKTHGITVERATAEGIPEKEATETLLNLWKQCDLHVAHNANFDRRIFRIALKRYFSDEIAEEFRASEKACTGLLSKPICKMLPKNRYGYKMPKLSEAYEFFHECQFENAHSAMADTRACMSVYWAITDHGKPVAATGAGSVQ